LTLETIGWKRFAKRLEFSRRCEAAVAALDTAVVHEFRIFCVVCVFFVENDEKSLANAK